MKSRIFRSLSVVVLASSVVASSVSAVTIRRSQEPVEKAVTSAPVAHTTEPNGYTYGRYGITSPEGVYSDGTHLFITNWTFQWEHDYSCLTEINISDGSLVKKWVGSECPFTYARSIVGDGTYVYIGAYNSGQIYRLRVSDNTFVEPLYDTISYNANGVGSMVMVGTTLWALGFWGLAGWDTTTGTAIASIPAPYHSNYANLRTDGTYLWWTDRYSDTSVVKASAVDGTILSTFHNVVTMLPNYGNYGGFAVSNDYLWVADVETNEVKALSKSDGSVVRTLSDTFNSVNDLMATGGRIYVATRGDNDVSSYTESNGAFVATATSETGNIGTPACLVAVSSFIWVCNNYSSTVSQLNPSDLSLVTTWSNIPIVAPSSPRNVVAIPGTEQALVAWDAPTFDGNGTVFEYTATAWLNGSDVRTCTTGGFSCVITNLSSETTYTFTVTAHTYGGDSDPSSEVSATTPAYNEYPPYTPVLMAEYNSSDYGFNNPETPISVGTTLWIPNMSSGQITIVNKSDGSVVQVLDFSSAGLVYLQDLYYDGTHVWATSGGSDVPLVEIDAATYELVRTFTDSTYALEYTSRMISDGTNLWVMNNGNSSITVINKSTGALVAVLDGATYGFSYPTALAYDGTNVWVASSDNSRLIAINASSRAVVHTLSAPAYPLSNPSSLYIHNGHLWVLNGGQPNITEIKLSDLSVMQVLASYAYAMRYPQRLIGAGDYVYVISGRNMTQIKESDGTVVGPVTDQGNIYPGNEIFPYAEGTQVWISDFYNNSLLRVETATPVITNDITRTAYYTYNDVSYYINELTLVNGKIFATTWDNAVLVIDATTGSLITTLTDASLELSNTRLIATDGTHVFVQNYRTNTITEFNASDYSLVRIIGGDEYQFDYPTGMVTAGGFLWVVSSNNAHVTKISLSDGSVSAILNDSSYGFSWPRTIATDGTHVFVLNSTYTSVVTSINISDNSIAASYDGTGINLYGGSDLVVTNGKIWITDGSNSRVVILNSSDLTLSSIISDYTYGLRGAEQIATDGTYVFVANTDAGTITEISAADGSLIKLIGGETLEISYIYSMVIVGPLLFIGHDEFSALQFLSGSIPSSPTNVSVTRAGSGSVTVSWTPPTDNGGVAIATYTVTAQPGGATCTATAPATSCTVSGLANGTSYTFTVSATNAVGTSTSSASSSSLTAYAPPTAPSLGSVAPNSSRTGIVINFGSGSSGGGGFTGNVAYAYLSNGTLAGSCTTTGTSCTITGLSAGVTYSIRLKTTTSHGDSSVAVAANFKLSAQSSVTAYVRGFSYASGDLSDLGVRQIAKVAKAIKAAGSTTVVITGYGNLKSKTRLSRARAQGAADALAQALSDIGVSYITITVKVGGPTDKFGGAVLNRVAVINAK